MDEKILISKEELEKLRAASGRLSEEVNLRKQAEEKLKTLNSDLAEYKHSEEKLFESEAKFSTVFQLSPIALSITSLKDQIFVDVNESFLQNVGYEREELVGQPANILDLWVDHGKRDNFRQLLAEHGKVDNYEFEFQGKKGKHGYGLVSATIIEINNEPCVLSQIAIITERKVIEKALKKSEESLKTAQHIAHIGSWELDIVNDILMWSDEIYRMFEIDPKKFEASYEAFLNAIHPEDRDLVNKAYTDSLEDKAPYDIVHRLQMPDGRIKYVNEKCETYYSEEGKPLRSVGTVHDITDVMLAEEAQRRLNRELRAISNCNQVLMRAVDEQTLLNDICQIICNEAGYCMAWVGFAEHDNAMSVRAAAHAGVEEGYLESANIIWADAEHGHGPSGSAIRTGESACFQDFRIEPLAAPWRESALQRGYRSSIALPLKDENAKTFGVLNIYSAEPNAFTPDEIRLLEELAGDLAFGIMVLRIRNERKQAVETLRESEESYRMVFENSPVSIWEEDFSGVKTLLDDLKKDGVTDLETYFSLHPETIRECADLVKIVDVNQAALSLHGAISKEELFAGLVNTFTPESFDTFRKELVCLWNGCTEMTIDAAVKTLAGERRSVTVYFSVCPGYGESLSKVFVSLADITERKQTEAALRESEEKYRTLILKIQAAVIVHGADTQIITSNPKAQELLGLTEDQLLGKTVIDSAWHFFLEDGTIAPLEKYPVSQVIESQKSLRNFVLGVHRPDKENDVWVLVNADPVFGKEGEIAQVIVTFSDITDRKQAEVARELNSQRTQSLLQLNQMTGATLKEITDFTLQEAVRLTQSKIGYLAFLNEDESVLTMHSWSKSAMAECAIVEKPILYPIESTGLWGEAVRQRRPVITNDYTSANPLKKGCPEGHVDLRRHMNTPVFDGSRIVIVAGVGNKAEEYDEGDVQQLTLIMEGMWRLIERKQAEESQEKERKRMEVLLSALNTGLSLINPDMTIAWVNQKIREMFPGKEPVGQVCHVFYESRATVCDGCGTQRAFVNGKVIESEQFVPSTGRWYYIISLPIKDTTGRVVNVLEGITDITERKLAEQKLKLLNFALNNVSDEAYLINEQACFDYVNDESCRALGYSREELLGMNVAEIDPDFPLELWTQHWSDIKEQSSTVFESHHRTKDGRVYPVEISANYFEFNGQGYNLALARDITERKRVEDALFFVAQRGWQTGEENFFNALAKFLGEKLDMDYVLIDKIDGNPDMAETVALYAKGAITPNMCYALKGTPCENVMGRRLCIYPHSIQQLFPEDTLLSEMGAESYIGIPLWDSTGLPIGLIAVMGKKPLPDETSVTQLLQLVATRAAAELERKHAEDEIRKLNQQLEQRVVERTAQLETANKELEAFAYSVSHDLRAPLRSIDGFSLILLEEYQNKLDEQGKSYFRRVRSASQRMAQLIDDMLNLSRVSRGELNIRQVNLSEIAKEVADELRHNQPEHAVEFIIQKGIQAQGDPRLLRIVLENLIENAWKFTSKHASARIEFGMKLQDNLPVYFIRDDGAGFDMNYSQKLFGAFQRLHTVDEFQGTGIGLATVQRVIHRHGGKVWAEGEVEKGATIYFTIA